ncbi:MAG: hypothetical protein ACOYKZ_01585 [Chlamydiia bacterium]
MLLHLIKQILYLGRSSSSLTVAARAKRYVLYEELAAFSWLNGRASKKSSIPMISPCGSNSALDGEEAAQLVFYRRRSW